jgi:hypothetical protein
MGKLRQRFARINFIAANIGDTEMNKRMPSTSNPDEGIGPQTLSNPTRPSTNPDGNYDRLTPSTTTHLLKQVLVCSDGTITQESLRSTVELFESIQPADAVEATLVSQMLTVHRKAMSLFEKSSNAFSIEQSLAYQRLAIKLMNLFSTQVIAFQKYRSGGRQLIKVEHVSIGQAAIGIGHNQ